MSSYKILFISMVLLIAPLAYYSGYTRLTFLHIASGLVAVSLTVYMAIVLQMIRTGRVKAKGAKKKRKKLFSMINKQLPSN